MFRCASGEFNEGCRDLQGAGGGAVNLTENVGSCNGAVHRTQGLRAASAAIPLDAVEPFTFNRFGLVITCYAQACL